MCLIQSINTIMYKDSGESISDLSSYQTFKYKKQNDNIMFLEVIPDNHMVYSVRVQYAKHLWNR